MKINKINIVIPFLVLVLSLFIAPKIEASTLSGRILLQVEDKGQAWYVNPLNNKRYFLGRPDDAFLLMKTLGLGVTNKDIRNFLAAKATTQLAGRILLQVEDKGQAYYVNPINLKLYYLGKPSDAFNVMRNLGLGITNSDLQKIAVYSDLFTETYHESDSDAETLRSISFKYRNTNYSIKLNLSSTIFNKYSTSPKVFSYLASNPPSNLQESFYNIFLQVKSEDNSIQDIIIAIREIAEQNNLSDEAVAEMALALVQYIPYDQLKADSGVSNPFYPYETIYLNRGVCSDTTFLAYMLLKELGYGVAILDFPDINHSALGIACPYEHSLSKSGYCYAETTNYFPIGVIPSNIIGQASVDDYDFDSVFDESKLGKIEIVNQISGLSYQRVGEIKTQVNVLKNLYEELLASRDNLDSNSKITIYNQKVDLFNSLLKDFYQK